MLTPSAASVTKKSRNTRHQTSLPFLSSLFTMNAVIGTEKGIL
jgi:hypothetical protein